MLECAQTYLKGLPFSKNGLMELLEHEGYTEEEIKYAVDNCGADWYEQAVREVQSYLKYSSYSRAGLIKVLEQEGFAYEQAVYAVDA